MKNSILLAGLLLTASLVVAPSASAHHCASPEPDVERFCNLVLHAPDPVVAIILFVVDTVTEEAEEALDLVKCLAMHPPKDWPTYC